MAVRCSSFTSGRSFSLHQRTCCPCRRCGGTGFEPQASDSHGAETKPPTVTELPINSEVSLVDERLRPWLVQIKRDEESGPAFYKVEVRDAEADPELSKSRQATDLDSLRAMLSSFRGAEIS